MCASITADRLRDLGVPDDLEIIEEARTLDKGGVEMLGRMLRQAKPAPRRDVRFGRRGDDEQVREQIFDEQIGAGQCSIPPEPVLVRARGPFVAGV